MAQFAEAGVLGLHSLENMPEAEVKATLSYVPSRIMGAAMRLGEFMRLNADHKVLEVLGIDVDGVSAVIINNVLASHRQAKAIPEVFAEKFRKTVPNPSDSTIVHFMDCFNNILTDFGLGHMMTVSDEELRFGKYHLVDRIISTLLMEKVRKMAAFHCIQCSNMMGMALYREVVKTFFDELHAMGINTSFGIEPFVKETSSTPGQTQPLAITHVPVAVATPVPTPTPVAAATPVATKKTTGGSDIPRPDSGKQVRYLFQNQNPEVRNLRDKFIAKFIRGTKLRDYPKLADDFVKKIYYLLDETHDPSVLEDDFIYHELCKFYHEEIGKYPAVEDNWSRDENRLKNVAPLLEHFIGSKKSINYLDVGCNEGDITKTIGDYLKAKTIEGCDVVDSLKNRDFTFHLLGDDEKYTLTHYKKSSKDFVSTFMSLHHIEELDTELKSIHRILKKDGVFLIREHDLEIGRAHV
jgi:hypothetical protein